MLTSMLNVSYVKIIVWGTLERTAEGHLSAASRQKLNHLVISPFSKCLNVENGGFGLNGYAAGVTCALNYYLVASV